MNRRVLAAALVTIGALAVLFFAARRFEPAPPEPSYDDLIKALERPGQESWKRAVSNLVDRGPAHVPELIEALSSGHRAVREGAAHAIGDLGPAAAAAVPALIDRVEHDDDDFVRWKAVRALGFIGPAAAPAIPLLEVVAANETELLQASAQAALRRIR